MPTKRHRKVRLWLKNKQARVVRRKPFTIQLLFETTDYVQKIDLGVDSGYLNVGLSAIGDKEEYFSAEVNLLNGMVERNKERASYRRNRRSRLRYRQPRFNNRKKDIGWLAPSIQHKLDSHIRLINLVRSILPIISIIIEVANFDIQKILKPGISGKEYQEGVQKDFYNLREYILYRDNHKCQNPDCKNKDKNPILVLHHIKYQENGGSNAPSNLITLCNKCHTPANHKKGKFLYKWQEENKEVKTMKDSTFMNIIRWKLVNQLECKHTYGCITKSRRIEFGIEKSHANDAFVIAGATNNHKKSTTYYIEQVKRNNRTLDKFYDAKIIDIRTGEKVSGQVLFNGRTRRNKNTNTENLRIYRGKKLSKGRRAIRKNRYPYQPKDVVLFNNKKYLVVGSQNKGLYVKLKDNKKVPKASDLILIKSGKGFCIV
jgi:hypothetical protein